MKEYAPVLLRFGCVAIFLYFGIRQIVSPLAYTGYLPAEISFVPLAPTTIVLLNGILEVFLAMLLMIGLFTRISAGILGFHLLLITFTVGFNDTGIRDFGLAIATLVILIQGPDRFCLDKKFNPQSQ